MNASSMRYPGVIVFFFSCLSFTFSQIDNESCEEATLLSVLDTFSFTESSNIISYVDDCYFYITNGFWYRIDTDSVILKATFLSDTQHSVDYVIFAGTCTERSCIEYGQLYRNSSKLILLFEEGTKYIFINSDNNSLIDNSLILETIVVEDNATCFSQTPIVEDAEYIFAIQNQDCDSGKDERWYSIEGNDEVVSLQFFPSYLSTIDIKLYQGSCSEPSMIASKTVSGGDYSLFNFYGQSGTTYSIQIEAGYCQEKVVNFKVRTGLQPINDFCVDAIDITQNTFIQANDRFSLEREEEGFCQLTYSSLWYHILGEDSIVTLSHDYYESEFLSLRENSCNENFTCIYDSEYSFYAERDKDYFLQVRNYPYDESTDIEFRKVKSEGIENAICENSITIICEDNIHADFTKSLGQLYYKVLGNDNIWTVKLTDHQVPNHGGYDVLIFSGSCTDQKYEGRYYLSHPGDSLQFVSELGTEYFFEIQDYDKQQPNAIFSFSCQSRAHNDECINAENIDYNTIYSTTFSGSTESLGHKCTYTHGGDIWYEMTGDGLIASLDLISSDQYYIDVDIYTGGCDNLQCLKSGRFVTQGQNPITFLTSEGESYLLVFRGNSPFPNFNFQFELNSFPPAENDLCEGSVLLQCGTSVRDSTHYATEDQDVLICSTDGPGVWYTFEGDDNIVELRFTDISDRYLELSLLTGECTDLSCSVWMVGIDVLDDQSSFYFHTVQGQMYYLLVSDDYNQTISYEFDVLCHAPVFNDDCSVPLEQVCLDTVCIDNTLASPDEGDDSSYSYGAPGTWTSFEGDGLIYYINLVSSELDYTNYALFEFTTCSSLQLIDRGGFRFSRRPKLRTELGKNYYVLIYGGNYNDRGTTKFYLSCVEPVVNDDCDNPIMLICGASQNLDFNAVSIDSNVCNFNQYAAWYNLVGNGQIVHLNITANYSYQYEISLYEKTECDALVCLESSDRYLGFLAEANTEYLVSFSLNTFYEGDQISISTSCITPASNDDIAEAQNIKCNDQLQISFIESSRESDTTCYNINNSRFLWYSYEGSDQILDLSLTRIGTGFRPLYIQILIDDGTSLNCVDDFLHFPSQRESISLGTYIGYRYIIGIGETNDDIPGGEMNLEVRCFDGSQNDMCFDAITLICDDDIDGTTANMTADYLTSCTSSNNYRERPNVWYKIVGADRYYNLLISDSNEEIEVYVGSCLELLCIGSSKNDVQFYGHAGIEYFISVSDGPFILNTLCSSTSPIPNDLCAQAIYLSCGEESSAIFQGATIDINTRLCEDISHPDIWYAILGTGQLIEFRSNDQYVSAQVNVFSGLCDDLQCVAAGSATSTKFIAEQGEIYYIQVSKKYDFTEDFNFSIMCRDPLQNDLCHNAELLECGQSFDTLLDIAANDNVNDCTEDILDPGLWFKIIGDGERWVIDNFNAFGSIQSLTIFEGSCGSCGYYIQPGRLHRNDETKYLIDTDEGVEYLILISFESVSRNNRMSFNVKCVNIESNTSIEQAKEIECEDTFRINNYGSSNQSPNPCSSNGYTLWYKIQGDGQIHEFTKIDKNLSSHFYVSVIEEVGNARSCIQLKNLPRNSSHRVRFLTEQSKTYYVAFTDRYLTSIPNTEWRHKCFTFIENDICANAKDISCDQYFKFNSEGALRDEYDLNSCDFYHSSPTVWYTIIGEGKLLSLKPIVEDNEQIIFSLYEGLCENLNCLKKLASSRSQRNVAFFLESGRQYFIKISVAEEDETITSQIDVNCVKPNTNSNCIGATQLVCGKAIVDSIDFSHTTSDFPGCNFRYPDGNWYHFKGNGSILKLSINTFGNRRLSHEFYKGVCDELVCLEYPVITADRDIISVTTAEDIDYYIFISSNKSAGNYYSVNLLCPNICPIGLRPEIIGSSFACSGSSYLEYSTDYVEGWQYKWTISDATVEKENLNSKITVHFNNKIPEQVDTLRLEITDLCNNKVLIEHLIETTDDEGCDLINCTENYIDVNDGLLNNDTKNHLYKAIYSVLSNASLSNNTSLIFEAGETIELASGFEVGLGSTFIASIKDCYIE